MDKLLRMREYDVVLHPFRIGGMVESRVASDETFRGSTQCMASRTSRAERRMCSATRQSALLGVLSWHLGTEIDQDDLRCNAHGKPTLAGGDLQFNLSHSGDWLYVAVSRHVIGVDIELHRPLRSRHAFAEYFNALINDDRHGRGEGRGEGVAAEETMLWPQWSRAEAVAKCIGIGMNVSLDAFNLPPLGGNGVVRIDTRYGPIWLGSIPRPAHSSAYIALTRPFGSIAVVGDEAIQSELSSSMQSASALQGMSVSWMRPDLPAISGM